MRIFVGIPLSKELRERVLHWQENFQYPISNIQLRWIAGKNLHVTLVPPFDSAQGLRPIIEKLKEVKREPFEIRFDRIEFGPNVREPGMIWAAGNAGEEIKKLKKLVEIGLGRPEEKREFRMHATLARLKNHPSLALPIKGREIDLVDWRQKIDNFVLYESRLLPQGADYQALAEYKI